MVDNGDSARGRSLVHEVIRRQDVGESRLVALVVLTPGVEVRCHLGSLRKPACHGQHSAHLSSLPGPN